MPELPEVETIRRDLVQNIVGKEIFSVTVWYAGAAQSRVGNFSDCLTKNTIVEIDRTGKLLIMKMKKRNCFLLTHLKMTGQLMYQEAGNRAVDEFSLSSVPKTVLGKHTHIGISFADGSVLYFNDMRKFGYMQIVGKEEVGRVKKRFGIEPLTRMFTWEAFLRIFEKRKTNLKALLLNQQLVAGLGNIYVDESCFRAGVLPSRGAASLSLDEKKRLYESIEQVIAEAIEKRGTSFRDYRDSSGKEGGFVSSLFVYGRAGQMCKICALAPVEKVRLAGRGTHFCPHCQK